MTPALICFIFGSIVTIIGATINRNDVFITGQIWLATSIILGN